MNPIIDYYFTVSSPWAYLGHARLREIAKCYDASLRYKPVNILELFSRTGGILLKDRSKERQYYRLLELNRWSAHLKINLKIHPKFLHTSDHLENKIVIALTKMKIDPGPLVMDFSRAIWMEDKNISDRKTLQTLINKQGIDGESLIASAENETTAAFISYTEEAIDRGVFGLPSYLTKWDLFWGQDRLDFLDLSLTERT